MHRAFNFRLNPTPAQAETLAQWAGVTRLIYNLALEQRRVWWRHYRDQTGSVLNFVSQGRQVTQLRAEYDWIRAAHSDCATQALRDLDRAYSNFFAGRAGYPTPRRKGHNDSFRITAGQGVAVRKVNKRWSEVRVPKLGWVRYRNTRPICGAPQNITVSLRSGIWSVSFSSIQEVQPATCQGPAVGIDRGIAKTLALSNGETYESPAALRAFEAKTSRARRRLAKCKMGSKRRLKKLRRLSRIAAKAGAIRKDWQHRISTDVARRFGTVVLEDLKVVNMTASGPHKRGLNRAILRQGWGAFAFMLSYKLQERGGSLVLINPAFTSQECSACGVIDRESRKSQASFECTSCGFALNADHNAAINILRRSTPVKPVEGRGCAPVEAGTCLEAA